jgi:hypothetical protein
MKKIPNLARIPFWSELTRKQKVAVLLFVAAMLVVGGELDRMARAGREPADLL